MLQRQHVQPHSTAPIHQSHYQQDYKTQGSVTDMTLNPEPVFKWMMLRADRAEYTRQCEELAGSRPVNPDRTHNDTKMLEKGG